MAMKRALLAACAVAFPLCSAEADQEARQFAQDSCRPTAQFAGVLHAMWERGDLREALPQKPQGMSGNIGRGLVALFTTIRVDPHLSRLSEAEFVELAARICEPVYEVYFEQRMKSE